MNAELREKLGRLVRQVWTDWANEQPSPKASWLVPWARLSEPEREVDRRIGERLFTEGIEGAIKVCETRADAERVYTPGPVGEHHALPHERAIDDIRLFALDGKLRPLGGAYAGLTAKKAETLVCKYIDSPHVIAGWGCCQCHSYNGLQRASCRGCGRARCKPLGADSDTGKRFETYEEAYKDDPEKLAAIRRELARAS
jgi:hypothetical protein